jgi:hypothetical protein
MASTNAEIYELGYNQNFKENIQVAILKAATQVSGEDPSGMSDEKRDKRHNLATAVIGSPGGYSIIFANICAAQSGLYSVITVEEDDSLTYTGGGTLDGDIEFTVDSVWDDVAGVSYVDNNP